MISVNTARVWVGPLFLVASLSGLLAGKPFSAVWNSPTLACQTKHGVTIPVGDYGIIANEGGVWWGDKMVIFYETQLGYYPELTPNETAINGGIPQLADVERHLTKVVADINTIIPEKDFDGYAVIDWEDWRPAYNRNWGDKNKYRRWSRDLVRQDHPDWEDDKVEAEAIRQFEDAAKLLMESTLEMAKDMRPKGKWGFYGFPRCYNHKGEAECSNDTTKAYNDQLSWLFEASTAIYPSGYIGTVTVNPRHFVYGQNTEALRVREEHSKPEVPVLMYTRYDKEDSEDRGFYNKTELDASLQLSIDMGLDGVIIWGSSSGANSKAKCEALKKYVKEEFGPYIKQKMDNAESCSTSLCNSNGRCFKKDPLNGATGTSDMYKPYAMHLNSLKMVDTWNSPMAKKMPRLPYRTMGKSARLSWQLRKSLQDGYSCRCFAGWTGDKCNTPASIPDMF